MGKARKLLNDLESYLSSQKIDYHLEGGTLLGLVRDGEFLEWDHDVDISIPQKFAKRFYSQRYRLWLKGYRVTKRKSILNIGPIKIGDLRIFKVKRLYFSFLSIFSADARNNMLVADIFVKFDDGTDTFWIAKERVMKAPGIHYSGFEEVSYNNRIYRAPFKYRDYLTYKFGDWSVPVKVWNCANDEKTIIAEVPKSS